jgi:phytoene dehydrogenase-like protein
VPKYDVAIIGAGLGGLTAAALLSSKKKKTIVIEQSATLSDALGVVDKEGFIFSDGPSLSYGFEHGGTLQQFSESLGIRQNTMIPAPCYQVALPDRRITVFTEHDETLEELKREFPKEINTIAKFYYDLDKTAKQVAKNRVIAALANWRSAKGFIGKYRFSRELAAFFDIQSLYFFQRPAADLSLAALITLCNTPPRHLHGGFRKFGDQLYGVVLQRGGEVRFNEHSPEFSFPGTGVIVIKTAQGVVEANTLLLNVVPSVRRAALFMGLKEDVVPVGMSRDVLFLPDYSRVHEFLALTLDGKEDDDVAPQGMRALTLSFRRDQNVLADRQTIVEQLAGLIPFLNDFMVFSEEPKSGAGHAIVPVELSMKPDRRREGMALLSRTSQRNVFVLQDAQEAPQQMISDVQRFVDKVV